MHRRTSLRHVPTPLTRLVAIACVTLALILVVVTSAMAHEKGVLKPATKTPRAGDSLFIVGQKFTHTDTITIQLVGLAGRVQLGAVFTDTAGGFRRSFLVPQATKEGQYRLVAVSTDSDEVASVEVVVQRSTAAPMAGMAGMPGMEGMVMDAGAPTGAPLQIVRATSTVVTGAIWLLIVACVIAGAALLRTPHGDTASDRP